jgi:hypothetical protein
MDLIMFADFTPSALEAIATLHNVTPQAKSSRDITQILAGVKVTVTPDSGPALAKWSAIATDRYLVAEISGEFRDNAEMSEESFEFVINSLDAVALAKIAKAQNSLIRIEVQDNRLTVSEYGQTIAGYELVKGNYPPLERLFPESDKFADCAQISLNPNKILQLSKVWTEHGLKQSASARKESPLKFTFTSGHNGKPGPVLVERLKRDAPAGTFRALIQPNLLLD